MRYTTFLLVLFVLLFSCSEREVDYISKDKRLSEVKSLMNNWKNDLTTNSYSKDLRVQGMAKAIDPNSIKVALSKENELAGFSRIANNRLGPKGQINAFKYVVNYFGDDKLLIKSRVFDLYFDGRTMNQNEVDEIVRKLISGQRISNSVRIQIRDFYTGTIEEFLKIEKGGAIAKNKFASRQKGSRASLNNTTNQVATSSCIDWYIVTTYTYPDGTQYTTEEYIGTTCDGCNPDPNYASVVSLECGNQNGGGQDGIAGEFIVPAKLCANYPWTTVGNSHTVSARNIGTLFKYQGNGVYIQLNVLFLESCITIPNYTATKEMASNAFNAAYNKAVKRALEELETGILIPMEYEVAKRIKSIVHSELNSSYPNSKWTTGELCAGSVPIKDVKTTDYCY